MRPPGTEVGFVDGPGNAAPAVADCLARGPRASCGLNVAATVREPTTRTSLLACGAWRRRCGLELIPQGSARFSGLPEESLSEITTVDTFHWVLLWSHPTTLAHTRVRNRNEHMDKCTPVLGPQPHLCHPPRTEPDSSMDSSAWRGEGQLPSQHGLFPHAGFTSPEAAGNWGHCAGA